MKSYANQPSGTIDRARQLRRDSTDAERKLWRGLREKIPHCKWRRQMPIGPYFADFACFAEKLIIELDGGQHGETVEYDAARTRFLEAQGYRVRRFWNNEVIDNIDGVLAAIANALTASPSHSAAPSGPLPLSRERAL